MRFRRFTLLLVAVLLLPGSVRAQQNLRAWFANGQTFVLWEHSLIPHPAYGIYTARQPIHSLRNAVLAELVLSAEVVNNRLANLLPGSYWKLTDTAGGTVTIDTTEAYGVITPLSRESIYVAVVRIGDTVVSSANTAGPIVTRIEPILPTIQYQSDSVTIYGHWVDGRADYQGGRPDYPPMANQFGNGSGHNFAVWEPDGGHPPGDLPLVIALHGGGGNLMNMRPSVFPYTRIADGLVATFDDGLCLLDSSLGIAYNNSFWLGYWNGLNRLAPADPPDTAVVVDYTIRRLNWELDWLRDNLPIDSLRISIMGASMGGMGTLFHTQVFPARFSAGIAFVPPLEGPVREGSAPLIGTREQNLRTNLPGSPGIWDILTQTWRLAQPHADWPPTVIVCGRNDTTVGWSDKPEAYRQLDSARTGFTLYWDQRKHTTWDSAHFRASARSRASYLTLFRVDQSFPAFSATDLDTLLPGRQPDPGNGAPQSGDTWGTWGGYLDWDKATLKDSTDFWEVRSWVVTGSPVPCDNSPSPGIVASVTPRRLQRYHPVPNQSCHWLLSDTLGHLLREGEVFADSLGTVTTPRLTFLPFPRKVRIENPASTREFDSGQRQTADAGFRVCPNPFVSFAAIPGREKERLDVHDASGRRVGTYQGAKLGEDLEPGVYFTGPAGRRTFLLKVVKTR